MHLVAQEHSVFTWNPVDARWVHERGPEMATPPTPPDVHAIQTYFFDPDGKEWIATVLAPRGRELAAQWQGAYKVPDRVAAPTHERQEEQSRAVVRGRPRASHRRRWRSRRRRGNAELAERERRADSRARRERESGAPLSPSPPNRPPLRSTRRPAPTQAPGGTPVRTQAPVRTPVRTPVPTVAPPVGTSLTLADGSVVTYSGPARVNIGAPFTVTFTVRNANNTPGTGHVPRELWKREHRWLEDVVRHARSRTAASR